MRGGRWDERMWCSADVLDMMSESRVSLVRSSVLGKTRSALREALQEVFRGDDPAPTVEDFSRPYEMDIFGHGLTERRKPPEWTDVAWFILEATEFRNRSITCFTAFTRMHKLLHLDCVRRMLPILLVGPDAHTKIDDSGKDSILGMPESPEELCVAADSLNILTCPVSDVRAPGELYDFFASLKEGEYYGNSVLPTQIGKTTKW